jgi:fructokinase
MDKKHKVAGIGELLWDVLPSGKQAGGAPFNFAYHACQAGCESYVFSAVGNDDLGQELLLKASQIGVNGRYIQENNYPTSTVTITLNSQGHPDYTIHENVAWDFMRLNADMNELAKELDAVCFGSLAQRNHVSTVTVQSFLSALKSECLKVFDINLRQQYFSKKIITSSLEFADVLKLNDEELPVLANFFDLQGGVPDQLRQLTQKFNLKCIAYTMGSKGSLILSPDNYSILDAPKVQVVDTVGAGDAFTAILIAGLLKKKPLTDIHKEATEVAAYVCTQKGAIPQVPTDIKIP